MAELFSRRSAPYENVSIHISGIAMSRGGTPLFSDLTTTIKNGDILWIQGDNGIGKTTLLGAVAGLHAIEAGNILWTHSERPCEASNIAAYQPHQSYAKPALTAHEDLNFWTKLYQSPISAEEALDAVGLKTKAKVRTAKLSAGQKRRLALAKLIVSEKPIWILDEPAAAMDQDGLTLIDSLLKGHIARGGSAVIASHGAVRSLSQATRVLTLRAMT